MKATSRNGFSLLEMLVVIAIIAIVWVMVAPVSTSMMMASRLSGASAQLVGLLSQARHTALAHNRTVEVRFYQFGDPEVPGEAGIQPNMGKFRAIQVFEYDQNGVAMPVTKIERLPVGIIVDANTSLSTLFDPGQKKTFALPLDPPVALPGGVGVNYNCMAFQFTPSGSTKLGFGDWFVTLHKATDGDNLLMPPSNYATVQVDAVSGAVRAYRP